MPLEDIRDTKHICMLSLYGIKDTLIRTRMQILHKTLLKHDMAYLFNTTDKSRLFKKRVKTYC